MKTIKIIATLLATSLAAVSFSIAAQSVYKTIGPDGKVIYSDHPPVDSKSQSTLLNAPKAAPEIKNDKVGDRVGDRVSEAATKDVDAKGKPAKTASRKPNAADAAKTETAPVVNNDVLEGAIIGVMGMESLVLQTEEACVNTLPTSMKRYSGAGTGWRERNATLIAQQRKLLATVFDADKRRLIVIGIKTKNDASFVPFKAANMAAKIKWCDQSIKEIESGAMDVFNNPKLGPPIMNYKAK
jgi:hypothetical protein